MQSPKAKSINKSRMMREKAAGVCWVWGELCEEVAEGWGLLSPRLFCSVLQLAMGRWRSRVEYFGLNLGDGMSHFIGSAFC